MKGFWRKELTWMHSWLGLLSGWVLYFVFVTGTLGYLDTEIDRWMQPELPAFQEVAVQAQVAIAEEYLQQRAPDALQWRIFTAIDRNQPWLKVQWRPRAGEPYQSQNLSVRTGEPLAARETGGGRSLYRMHYAYHYIPRPVTRWIASISAFVCFTVLLAGIVMHRNLIRDWFTFRSAKGVRTGLDLHLLAGVAILPFFLMISYSGALFYIGINFNNFTEQTLSEQGSSFKQLRTKPAATERLAESSANAGRLSLPAALEQVKGLDPQQIRRIDLLYPNQKAVAVIYPATQFLQRQEKEITVALTKSELSDGVFQPHRSVRALYESVMGLHEGTFASPGLRLGYLFSGVLGCLSIASGLLVWQIKRARRLKKRLGFRIVRSVNLAVIIGLPFAIVIYFIANRVLPLTLPDRAAWELDLLFISWATVFMFSWFSAQLRAWALIAALTALSLLSLPWLSYLFTENNIYHSFKAQDWVFVGFEMSAIFIGSLLLGLSLYLHQRGQRSC